MARLLMGLPPKIATADPLTSSRLRMIGIGPGMPMCVRPWVRELFFEPSGRTLNVATVPMYDKDARPDGCLAILQDVTLRVALEQEVQRYEDDLRRAAVELERKNRELEEANRHKDEFIARMSHELRTPLHCIIGYTDLALRSGGSLDDAANRQNLRTTMACAHDLLDLINDVFDLASVERGVMGTSRWPVELHALVVESIETVRPLVGDRPVRLAADVGREEAWIETDPLRLKQVLLNLLGNAIKFTDEGQISVKVERSGDRVLVHVSDTGVGIPEAEHSRIFERFYQVDGGRTRRHGGAGLGLALVGHMVRILGGEVSVRSAPGMGSRFTVSLPAG
jgi:signal transduction histidine kinase